MTNLQKELNETENKVVPSLSDDKGTVIQTTKGSSIRFLVHKPENMDYKVIIFYNDEENTLDKTKGDDAILLDKVKIAKEQLAELKVI